MNRIALFLTLVAISLGSCASSSPSPDVVPYRQERFVILTADDFGASENINEGIEFALSRGAITAVSALMNFPSSHGALKELADRYPQVGIGVHFNLNTGTPVLDPRRVPSLVDAKGNFLAVDELLSRIRAVSLVELELELRAQIHALEGLSIRLDHLSDHNGIFSFYPPFFEVFTRLAREFGVPVRSPLTASMKYPRLFPDAGTTKKGKDVAWRVVGRDLFGALGLLPYTNLASIEERVERLDELGIPHPGILMDYLYGNPTPSTAIHMLRNLPAGVSEIVVHLGTWRRSGAYPTGLDIDYFAKREQELAVVTSEYLREYARSLNIRAIGFEEAVSLLE
ncbi:MAG: ChbG/HpnK family deacetylase [Spirochaetes bacterium]|nr:ChbG/HpnK family deacetylase [Spirochaetota bacterium]